MRAWAIGFVTFLCVAGGVFLGLFLQHRLPVPHLSESSKDVVKLVTALLTMLSALVLGLVIASAKNSFDTVNESFRQNAAKLVVIDRLLALYGPEAKGVRQQMKEAYSRRIDRLFHKSGGEYTSRDALEDAHAFADFRLSLEALRPTSDAQRELLSRGKQLTDDVAQTRWLALEEASSTTPPLFMGVQISWLVMMFTSFGLFAPRNGTTIAALLCGAFAVATSIFLIEEMQHPFTGWIAISSEPMHNALAILGQ